MTTATRVRFLALFCFGFLCAAQAPSRPEFIGGKGYTRQGCLRIARWVIRDDNGFNTLTGVELGNLVSTLDDCDFLQFNETTQHPRKAEKADITFALDLAWHHYMRSLEKVIMHLPDDMRRKALDDLAHTSVSPTPSNDFPPWSPLAKDCADAWQLMQNKPKDWKAADASEKKLLEKCLAASDVNSRQQHRSEQKH